MTTTTKDRIRIERTFKAPIEKVWRMWTTKEGIEKWWGPEGFATVVRSLDLRVGGPFEVVMSAVRQDVIDYVKSAGVPEHNVMSCRYTELVPMTRLAYATTVNFIPGMEPYESITTVELAPALTGTFLVLTFDAMHDAHWTSMAKMGWESELGKLDAALA